jgi:hypothetical protein
LTLALTRLARTVAAPVAEGVVVGELVPVDAVGFAVVLVRAAAADVLEVGHCFEVVGVDAAAVETEVVNLEVGRDRPYEVFVGDSVDGVDRAVQVAADVSVALGVDGSAPLPTPVRHERRTCQKSLNDWDPLLP